MTTKWKLIDNALRTNKRLFISWNFDYFFPEGRGHNDSLTSLTHQENRLKTHRVEYILESMGLMRYTIEGLQKYLEEISPELKPDSIRYWEPDFKRNKDYGTLIFTEVIGKHEQNIVIYDPDMIDRAVRVKGFDGLVGKFSGDCIRRIKVTLYPNKKIAKSAVMIKAT